MTGGFKAYTILPIGYDPKDFRHVEIVRVDGKVVEVGNCQKDLSDLPKYKSGWKK